MASVSETSSRANIRIEIKNDFTEEMDVDEGENNVALSDAEIEDGEISDEKSAEDIQEHDNQTRKLFTNRNIASSRVENQWLNTDGGFSTGVDVFGKEEQEKLQTRAQRFGLKPDERKGLTDEQLHELHDSLGITEETEANIRFEAIHMYGTKDMSTQDVFEYFGKYGPSSIEWISDVSCNVVWLDKISAARAFYGVSKGVDGMPMTGKCDPFETDEDKDKDIVGRSILLKDREIILSDDGKEIENKKIHISEINIPIPPGYWRLGHSHSKAKYILLRFANRSDKKPLKAEKFSEYYRKYGNPNFGGIQGLISQSKKKRMKGILPEEKVPKGNPWGNLAKNWNNDPLERLPETEETVVPYQPKKVSKSILNRLGTNKRTHQSDEEEKEEEKPEPKKSKVPRMRMYADEEEARIEKVKQMKKIRELEHIEEKMAKTVPDLRNRIGRHAVAPTHSTKTQKIPQEKIPEPVKLRPVRIEVTRKRSEEKEVSSDNSEEDEDVQVQQKSKVTVIVKKPTVVKPTVASTIWSRLDLEKRKQKSKPEAVKSDSESKSDSSDSSDSDSDSDDEQYNSAVRQNISKAVNSRPGFNRDLKSRLGLNTDHKSPLRIEINNDHYKKT